MLICKGDVLLHLHDYDYAEANHYKDLLALAGKEMRIVCDVVQHNTG